MELKGLIDEIIYHNEINGYTVCTIETDDELITAVGYLPFINAGDNVVLQGEYTKHAEYGEQFKIESFEKTMPQDTKSLEKYLASGIIKGVGEVTAYRIIERFGDDTINILKFEPDKLAQVKGISHKKAIEISESFNREWELWQIVKFLENYGVGANHAKKVYKELGADAIEKIEKNPYILLDILYGVNFKEIDKIGIKLGIDFTNETRVQSGIKYAISIANLNGHTCVLKQNLIEFTKNLLSISEEIIEDNLINLKAKSEIVIHKLQENEWIYLEPFYKAEENIANKIKDMSNTKCKKIKNISAKIMHLQEENGIILSEEQKEAIETAVNKNVCIITGGPGTR